MLLLGAAWFCRIAPAQTAGDSCVPPLCVSRSDDSATAAQPGMLRYAVKSAPKGATITFDPALNGKTIRLDGSSPNNHIKIAQDLTIQGPGAQALTISGENATRIFLVTGGVVQISGLTLANGLAKGGDGAPGEGGAGGGGGAAGMGGAIFLQNTSLIVNGVSFNHNRAIGGNGGAGGSSYVTGNGGGGGGFAGIGKAPPDHGGSGGDLLEFHEGVGGSGGSGDAADHSGGEGHWAGGGGGSGFRVTGESAVAGFNGAGGFGGGIGGVAGYYAPGEPGVPASGGSGGCGFGGAIFASSGMLQIIDSSFVDNAAIAGHGNSGAAKDGLAKGGSLFVCSGSFCGPGHESGAIWAGNSSARGSVAADVAGYLKELTCEDRDDADVCGRLTAPTPTHFGIYAPAMTQAGTPFPLTIAALDANNNLVFSYAGTVLLTSTDPNANLPQEVILATGVARIPATLRTAGAQTVTASEKGGSVLGRSDSIAVETVGSGRH